MEQDVGQSKKRELQKSKF